MKISISGTLFTRFFPPKNRVFFIYNSISWFLFLLDTNAYYEKIIEVYCLKHLKKNIRFSHSFYSSNFLQNFSSFRFLKFFFALLKNSKKICTNLKSAHSTVCPHNPLVSFFITPFSTAFFPFSGKLPFQICEFGFNG